MIAPPSKIILRTLKELSYNHMKGILILVPGNTENLFNFGLAVERAKNDNLRVRIIQVTDSQDENSKKQYGRKGSTGVLLLSKIAGAMSEEGKSLSDIYTYCNEIAGNIVTVELNGSLEENSICSLCKKIMCKETDIQHSGIIINESSCLYAVEDVINIIPDDTFEQETGKINLKPDDAVVVLINNKGSLKKNSEFMFIKELIQFLSASLIHIKRIYLGNFIFSNDVTITFLKVEHQEILEYLEAPCNAFGK